MRAGPDRPLSDAQERALAGLARRADAGEAWTRTYHVARAVTTVSALEQRGLVEMRPTNRRFGLDWEARITEAGRAMLASMGD